MIVILHLKLTQCVIDLLSYTFLTIGQLAFMLENIELLNGLSEQEIKSLELLCQERFVAKWEMLFKEWDLASAMYLLKEGEMEVFINKNWEELILGYIRAEEMLWEMALFWEKGKRTASARAIKDSRIIVLLDFWIRQLAQNNPKILEKIKKIIELRNNENKQIIWI